MDKPPYSVEEMRDLVTVGVLVLVGVLVWLGLGLRRKADDLAEMAPDTPYETAAGCGKQFVTAMLVIGAVVAIVTVGIAASK